MRISVAVGVKNLWNDSIHSRSIDTAESLLEALSIAITASAAPQVSVGDESVAIEGQTGVQLIAGLLPLLRADGGNDGKRLSQIDTNENGGAMDRLLPILHPAVAKRYALLVRHGIDAPALISVEAMSVQQRETALAAAGHAAPDDA